jgi:hypothetical protein
VCQAGRHRAERFQALAVLLDRRDAPHDGTHPRQHQLHDRAVRDSRLEEVLRLDQRQAHVRHSLDAHAQRRARQRRDRADPGRRDVVARGLLTAADVTERRRRALEQQVDRVAALAFPGDLLAGTVLVQHGVLGDLGQVLVVDTLEQVDRP